MNPPEHSKLPVLLEKDGTRKDDHRIQGQALHKRNKWGLGGLFGEKAKTINASISPQQFQVQKKFRKAILLILVLDFVLIGTCIMLLIQRM